MKRQVWLQPHEWAYIACCLKECADSAITTYVCGKLGQLEAMRLREVCSAAASHKPSANESVVQKESL